MNQCKKFVVIVLFVLFVEVVGVVDLFDCLLYIYCELLQLQFNICVLDQVLDESMLLQEWLKFLLIFFSNMDEFFEICVVDLKDQIVFDYELVGLDGIVLKQVLVMISELVYQQIECQYVIFNECILFELVV